jgi:tRNA pseudouridine(55) synthase
MKRLAIITKSVGQTPLQALERYRTHAHINSKVPMCYAGRLDPMASGELLLLIGDECKKLKKHCAYDKEYEIRVVLDIQSDTGDILGIVQSHNTTTKPEHPMFASVAKNFIGPYHSFYPVYSSKTVKGKPLFLWALEGRLNEIELPRQHGVIKNIRVDSLTELKAKELYAYAVTTIATLPKVTEETKRLGEDFRRDKVLDSWQSINSNEDKTFVLATITVRCSSGVYMRTLAQDIGEALHTKALALSINRKRILVPFMTRLCAL